MFLISLRLRGHIIAAALADDLDRARILADGAYPNLGSGLVIASSLADHLGRIHDLAEDLVRDLLDLNLELALAHHSASAPVPRLIRDLNIDLHTALARPLARANSFAASLYRTRRDARHFARYLAAVNRGFALRLVRRLSPERILVPAKGLVVIITNVRNDAVSLASDLGRLPADASGADLTGISVGDPEWLGGVIWTEETRWPPGVEDWVRHHSREIEPGRYQVAGGSEREDAGTLRV